eukprot:gene7039-7828_t
MTPITGLCKLILFSFLLVATRAQEFQSVNQPGVIRKYGEEEERIKIKRQIDSDQDKKHDKRMLQNIGKADHESLDKVTFEVQRLFDSWNEKRSRISESNEKNENEITIIIENDGNEDDNGILHEEKKDKIERIPDDSGFSIILDSTKDGMKDGSNDFDSLSRSFDKMDDRFERYLSEEKEHTVPTISSKVEKVNNRRTDIERGHGDKNEDKILEIHSIASKFAEEGSDKKYALKGNKGFDVIDDKLNENQVPLANPSLRSSITKSATRKLKNHAFTTSNPSSNHSTVGKIAAKPTKSQKHADYEKQPEKEKDGEKSERSNSGSEEHDNAKRKNTTASAMPTHLKERRKSTRNVTRIADESNDQAQNVHGDKINNNDINNESTVRAGEKILHPRKAQAMLEYINKDPLEAWVYKFASLKELGLNSTMLRNGLVNAGSIDRLKNVMKRALKGEDITVSVVGGSISAGGGLYKDEENIAGLYYKGLVDWWNRAITPLTGSEMKVNNIAIGSIGTDYFSYCLGSHISNDTNIILWELSGNDYNRYLRLPTKGAKPLERLTRMSLMLPRDPALLYVNFFKGVDYKKSKKTCPNFEDQGEDIIAHYYKIPSLSWRAMVCGPLMENKLLFTLSSLFCKDQYHPSLRAHAQMALLLILHVRHVMRSVLQMASANDGFLPDFNEFYTAPPPLFLGLDYPTPLCWTLITPDFKESISDTLDVRILNNDGFKLEYATNFPIRFDRVICWKAETPNASMKIQFYVPDNLNRRENVASVKPSNRKTEIAITTHTRFGGSAEVWIDQRPDNPQIIKEGREFDTGKRTQVDLISKSLDVGVHTFNMKTVKQGFCLTSIMID